MDIKDPNIRNQDAVYRRGLVLGLTMAEIMILILFTLLLALAAALDSRESKIHDKDKRIAELTALEQQVSDLLRNNPAGVTVADIIQRIVRQQEAIAGLQREVDRLKTFEEPAHILEDIIREIRRAGVENPTPQKIIERLKLAQQLTKENENLRGQNAQLSRQIKESGRGNEFPSCWATPDGKTESIFEILIKPGGIVVYDRDLPRRTTDKADLPLESVHYNVELQLRDFQKQLRPLYLWSVRQKCRFYVIIFSSEDTIRANLVNAVNAFFYPDSSIQLRR